jgi:two-component system, cell cycle sensor histidine kinase and response regulator CckA
VAPARLIGRLEGLGHELLLLMLNLSRMHDREQILRLFVEAVGTALPEVSVCLLRPGEERVGEIVEVATPEMTFGRIAVEDRTGKLPEPYRALYRNAARMLAVVLENVYRAEQLASENARLDGAVAERTAELRRALARSEDLYQNAPCGYHALDADGLYVQVNDTELRWLGYAREELVGRRRFADGLAPTSRESFARAFAWVRVRGAVQDVELELVRKDGTLLPVLVSASAVIDPHGRFLMARATLYDLSERQRGERALRESEEQLRQSQKLEALGRLAGGVAHDFNNLLTIILSCSSALLEGLGAEAPLRQEALEIDDAARRAAQLTRQLLSFGRCHSTQPVPLDLGEVVAGMEHLLRRLIGEGVALEVSRGTGLRAVHADPAHMEQVILNLVVNARDAVGGGGRIVVETSNLEVIVDEAHWVGAPPGQYVCLAVSDTGCGMAPEVRTRLFEPYFTTKAEGKGTGLGLATVYGIVKRAGGEIHVESAPGQGARFEVLLPPADEGAAARPTDARRGELERGSETILLVEDEPRVRAVAALALRHAGYAVLEASDGEDAAAVATGAGRIDALVTDVVMPRLGGVPLAARLRALRPELMVVFVSGYAGEGMLEDELAAKGTTVLYKPFTAPALLHAVRQQLDSRRAGEQRASRPGATPA